MKQKATQIKLIRENWEQRAVMSSVLCENIEELLKTDHEILHPKEQTYFNQLSYPLRRKSYILGRHAAKQAISSLKNEVDLKAIEVDFGIFHQPIIKGSYEEPIDISISHSDHSAVALAYPSGHPMGIDLEKIDYEKKEIYIKQLTETEKTLMKELAIGMPGGAILLWSAKEALSKALKSGLAVDYDIYETKKLVWNKDHLTGEFVNFAQYRFEAFLFNKHVMAITLPKKTKMQFGDWFGELF